MASGARRILNLFRKGGAQNKRSTANAGTLNSLFHPLPASPIPAMRALGERIARKGRCPTTGESPLGYVCPVSGYPTHVDEAAWRADATHEHYHEYAQRLREVNEDEHDLRSGRDMTEFELPPTQDLEHTVNLKSWEMLFYTRNFNSIDSLRSQRHLSRLLSYPMTVAGVLHELGPYADRAGGRVSGGGERSLLALRHTLHKQPTPYSPPTPPVRIFIPGARAESQLPPSVWMQLAHLFPHARLHVYFVGPEVNAEETIRPFGVPGWSTTVNSHLTLSAIQASWEEVHDAFYPYDPFTDIFFNFHPGLGFPSMLPSSHRPSEGLGQRNGQVVPFREFTPQIDAEWATAFDKMLSTKCPIVCTAFGHADIKRDVDALLNSKQITQEWETVIEPGNNVFSSQRWEVAEFDTRVMIKSNWGLWAVRGRRYDIQNVEMED